MIQRVHSSIHAVLITEILLKYIDQMNDPIEETKHLLSLLNDFTNEVSSPLNAFVDSKNFEIHKLKIKQQELEMCLQLSMEK